MPSEETLEVPTDKEVPDVETDDVPDMDKSEGEIKFQKNIDEFIEGNKSFDDVLDAYAKVYADVINSNKA